MQILASSMSWVRRIPLKLLTPLAAGLMCVAACGDDSTGPGPGARPEINIEPDSQVELFVGDTITIRATVRNLSDMGVQYVSSAPEVVEVDGESGMVTAVAPGEATVTAYSAIDPRISAEAPVTVHEDLPAGVRLEWLRDPSGDAVATAATAGVMTARFAITPGNSRRLEVWLRDQLVCEVTYHPVPGEVPPDTTMECTVDTAAFDPETAEPQFLNGGAGLHATLLGSGDRTLAAFEGLELTLANPAKISAEVSGDRSAVDANGDSWIGGDVTVSAVPIRYEAGAKLDQVRLRYRTPDGRDTTITATSGPPFTFRLPVDGILRAVVDSTLRISLASHDAEGEAGPEVETPPLRYDAAPPRPGSLLPREWIGAQVPFASVYDTDGEWDDGVGRVHARFYAGDASLTAEQITDSGMEVESGSDLEQTEARAYRLVAQVCDALDNCTLLDGFPFGVDLTPPLIESLSLADRAINPTGDLIVTVKDDGSGVAERPLEVIARLIDASAVPGLCGPVIEGHDLPGRVNEGGCVPDTVETSLPVPRTTPGYFRYSIRALDRAGNRSEAVERIMLVDHEPPSIEALTMPDLAMPGSEMSVGVEVADNLDLAEAEFKFVFRGGRAGAISLPFTQPLPLGVPFEEPLLTRETVAAEVKLVRTLTFGEPASRVTALADSLAAEVRDVAGHQARVSTPLLPAHLGDDLSTTDPFPRYGSVTLAVEHDAVCISKCSDEDPASVSMTMRVDGQGGTGRPFAYVNFLLRDRLGRTTLVGSLPGEEAIISNVDNRSTFQYTVVFEPSGLEAGGYSVIAVGVNSRGNALSTDLVNGQPLRLYAR